QKSSIHTHTHTHTHNLTPQFHHTVLPTPQNTAQNVQLAKMLSTSFLFRGLSGFIGTHDTREYMEATQDTHTRRPEVAVNLFSAFFPFWTVLPQAPPRSSGQLCSARGPSEVNCPSLVRDGHEFCCFACFWHTPDQNHPESTHTHTHTQTHTHRA